MGRHSAPRPPKRYRVRALLLALALAFLANCAKPSAVEATPNDSITKHITIVEVERPDGTKVECAIFWPRATGAGISCDWPRPR